MTKRIAITLIITAAALVVVVSLISPAAQAITLTFNGYSDNGTKALFAITNHTQHYAVIGFPGIEFPAVSGWTNYCDGEELLLPVHAPLLNAGRGWSSERKLPPGQRTWRAHLYYRIYPGDRVSTPRRFMETVLERVGLSTFGKERVTWIAAETR